MIQSKILEYYSPLIIPFTFITGTCFIETDMLFQKKSFIGNILLIVSLLILYDRIEANNDAYLGSGLILFYISYILFRYMDLFKNSTAIMMLISLCLIAEGIQKFDIYSYKNQYVYFSLAILFVSLIILIPMEVNHVGYYFVLPSIAYTILSLSTIDIPFKKLK